MEDKKIWHWFFYIIFLLILILASTPNNAWAKVTGICSNCHTMHSSQNGSKEDAKLDYGVNVTIPNQSLTKAGCIGCHSSTDSDTIKYIGGTKEDFDNGDARISKVPIVYNTQEPTYPLAGGNFYWMVHGSGNQAEKDARGHNVKGISPIDSVLVTAPGKPSSEIFDTDDPSCAPCHKALTQENCGCKACHVFTRASQSHHKDDHPGGNYNNIIENNVNSYGWYRFLYSHNNRGVKGIESADWEQLQTSDLNQYQGVENLELPFMSHDYSMTDYCAGCHQKFHGKQDIAGSGTGTGDTNASPWFRHPSHIGLPATPQYQGYQNYSREAPVARRNLTGYTDPVNRKLVQATGYEGNDQVMCLSCHYAHGSRYPDLLRWDYDGMIANGGGSGGCFTCHTNKN